MAYTINEKIRLDHDFHLRIRTKTRTNDEASIQLSLSIPRNGFLGKALRLRPYSIVQVDGRRPNRLLPQKRRRTAMKLYHGTNIDFEKIDIAKSKPNKDFGRGFYLSADYKQAQNMANIKFEQMETGKPLVQEYSIDEQEMQNLKILVFDDYTEEWAKFILLNRNNPSATPAHNYDIVIGPIANDRVGVQLWKYENQLIDLPTLVKRLKYMKGITIQYFFGTERAIQLLKRV